MTLKLRRKTESSTNCSGCRGREAPLSQCPEVPREPFLELKVRAAPTPRWAQPAAMPWTVAGAGTVGSKLIGSASYNPSAVAVLFLLAVHLGFQSAEHATHLGLRPQS